MLETGLWIPQVRLLCFDVEARDHSKQLTTTYTCASFKKIVE